jgi:hypothetical protein
MVRGGLGFFGAVDKTLALKVTVSIPLQTCIFSSNLDFDQVGSFLLYS